MVDSRLKRPSNLWHRYSILVAATTVLLIWWGAAVTTKQAGMAFSDWPLSQGSVNPDGWLKHLAYFLEHGHRLIASVVGVLTLALFATAFVRSGKNVIELLLLIIGLAAMVELVRRGGAEKMIAERKEIYWWAATAVGALTALWLVYSCRWRQWSLTCKLSALALLLVTFQALMGGIRVTEISDAFAVVHGCLAQGFFCLLVLIVLASSSRWPKWRLEMPQGSRNVLRVVTSFLCSAVFIQLTLGALMRHHHRFGLADTGILMTGGAWLPPFDKENEILVVMFFHKYWAFLITALTFSTFLWVMRNLNKGHLMRRLLGGLVILLLLQITLGISVIITGKSFWITNLHVLNGLLILAASFVLAMFAWRSVDLQVTQGSKATLPIVES